MRFRGLIYTDNIPVLERLFRVLVSRKHLVSIRQRLINTGTYLAPFLVVSDIFEHLLHALSVLSYKLSNVLEGIELMDMVIDEVPANSKPVLAALFQTTVDNINTN